VKDRQELDAGNSVERPDTFEQVVASVFNNKEIVLTTEALPGLHELLAEPMALTFSDMPGGAIDAEDVKSRLGDARAKIIQAKVLTFLVTLVQLQLGRLTRYL